MHYNRFSGDQRGNRIIDGEQYCDDCTDAYPDGDYVYGGGEQDSPAHCRVCGVMLDFDLTSDGVRYVIDTIRDELKSVEYWELDGKWPKGHHYHGRPSYDMLYDWAKIVITDYGLSDEHATVVNLFFSAIRIFERLCETVREKVLHDPYSLMRREDKPKFTLPSKPVPPPSKPFRRRIRRIHLEKTHECQETQTSETAGPAGETT